MNESPILELVNRLWTWLSDMAGHPLFPLSEGNALTLGLLAKLLLIVVGIFVVESLIRKWLVVRVLKRTRLQESLQYAIGRIAGYVFIVIAIFVAVQTAGIDLSSLAIFAGAVGLGVGFGLQNLVSNLISGVIILAERPIGIGDRIEVAGVGGIVRAVNIRSTTVVTNDNISIIVPNQDLIANAVTNWSHGDPKVRIRLPVGIAYGSDVPKFRDAMLEVVKTCPGVLEDPAPDVFFDGFGDSSLDFEVVVWTREMTTRPHRFRSNIFFAIEAKLREVKIEIPFPQRDLHIRTNRAVFPVQSERSGDSPDQ